MKANIVTFATILLSMVGTDTNETQTENDSENLLSYLCENNSIEHFIGSVCEVSQNMVSYKRSYLTSLIFAQIVEKDQVKLI